MKWQSALGKTSNDQTYRTNIVSTIKTTTLFIVIIILVIVVIVVVIDVGVVVFDISIVVSFYIYTLQRYILITKSLS